jgi:hypothetical protein
MNLDFKTIIRFFLLIIITLISVYYFPKIFGILWLIVLLFLYWYSKNESFWFAFFLVLSDGFMGFFGLYETTISLIPGMPEIEVSQFYIILTIIKGRLQKPAYPLFFRNILNIMGVYLIVLIVLGFTIGLKPSFQEYFRIIKLTLPFLLFYSIPRLLKNDDDYYNIFKLLFPISILALIAQIFEIVNIQPLTSYLGAKEFEETIYREDEPIRSFYNSGIVLLCMFGSLFYFSKKQKSFNGAYMNIITIASFLIAFLSATRGWIIGFGITLILFFVINLKFSLKRILVITSLVFIVYFGLMGFPVVRHQVINSYIRFMTVEKITEGDISADETQKRTTIRGPRVMKKWSESPIMGYGFSDEFKKSYDAHVGNQNILLHSGIVGFALMIVFFLSFISKMIITAINSQNYSLLVFVVFFIGWYFIHSTSGQHFAYSQIPAHTLPQALFFCFGAFCLDKAKNKVVLQR